MQPRSLLLAAAAAAALSWSAPAPAQATCPFTTTGSLAPGDPVITGYRIFRDDPPSTCAASTNCTPANNGTYFYRSYTFTNDSADTRCVTVTITPACNGNSIQVAAYLGSFDPTNACGAGSNYLADSGADLVDGTPKEFSFQVVAGATFVVVVNGTVVGGACQSYTLAVANCTASTPVTLQRFDAQ